jgi:chromosome segregation ATPase
LDQELDKITREKSLMTIRLEEKTNQMKELQKSLRRLTSKESETSKQLEKMHYAITLLQKIERNGKTISR